MRLSSRALSLACAAALIAGQTGMAGAASLSETRGYLGVAFPLQASGGHAGPEVILGAVRASTDSTGDLRGMRAALHVGLTGGIRINSLRITALAGQTNLFAELGAGYSFGQGLFPTWGIAGNHLQIGGAFGQNAPSNVAFGFITLQEFDTPVAEVVAEAPADDGDDDVIVPPPLCPTSRHELAC